MDLRSAVNAATTLRREDSLVARSTVVRARLNPPIAAWLQGAVQARGDDLGAVRAACGGMQGTAGDGSLGSVAR